MRRIFVFALATAFTCACGPSEDGRNGSTSRGGTSGGVDGGGTICKNPPKDSDHDGISDHDEGGDEKPPRDTDHDGTPDYLDNDSDNDGIPDSVEARNAGNPCDPPVDSDGDGKADFRDLDSDDATDSTVPDKEEAGPDPLHPVDTNMDGKPDYMDPDDDGDGIIDLFELTPQGQAVAATTLANAPDTDGDGIPDFRDTDSDNDTINDRDDGNVDTDGDLIPNYRDTDSDGDCVLDANEAGDADPSTPPVDTDHDGAPDFEDVDTDNDGLTDGKEDKNCNGALDPCETDRLRADTDGDGVSDLIEYEDCAIKTPAQQTATMCQCDGSNPNLSPLSRGDFVFTSDYMMSPMPGQETLNLTTDVSRADVMFMLDTTSSMGPCATDVATNLGNVIVPGVAKKVKDVAYGLVTFNDFLDAFVVKYNYRIQTVRTTAAQSATNNQSIIWALNNVGGQNGYDLPEAGWVALYSIVAPTGVAALTANSGTASWTSNIQPVAPTTPLAGEEVGNIAQAGFRSGAVPIIVAVSDAAWHDKPGTATSGEDGLFDYGSGTDCASGCENIASRAQTIQAVNNIGGHVMGLAPTGGSNNPKQHFIALAQQTAAVVKPSDFVNRASTCTTGQCCTAVDGSGEGSQAGQCPLAYDINRTTTNGVTTCAVTQAVVDGIAALASGLTFDIHVVASDVDPGTVDDFIDKLVPNVSGTGAASMCIVVPTSQIVDNFIGPKATPKPPPPAPGDGVPDTFLGIGGGVQVCFDVVAKENMNVMNTDQPQIFRAQLQVIGQTHQGVNTNSFNLGTPRQVFFLVPPVIKNGPIS